MAYHHSHPSPRNRILARDSMLLVAILGAAVLALIIWAVALIF